MNQYIKASIILLILDSIYLNFTQSHFRKLVNNIQNSPLNVNIYAAILCYIVLVFGFNYFIVKGNKSILHAMILGFVIYAVYDLTNMAILKNWNITTVVMDILWGTTLFGLTAYLVKTF